MGGPATSTPCDNDSYDIGGRVFMKAGKRRWIGNERSQTLSHFSFLSSTISSRHDTKWSDPFRCSPARDEGKKLSLFLYDSSPVTSTETFPLLRGPGSHFAFFLRAVEAPRPLLTQTVAPSSLVDFRFRGSDRRRCVSSPSSVPVWVANSSAELSMERFWLNLNPFRFRLLRALLFGKGLPNLTTCAHSHPTPAKISLPQALSAYVSFVVLEPDPTSTGIMGFARFVNVGDERGETPLHLAARRRWTECVHVLLDHGALVSSSTREYGHSGSTPLHLAARGGSLDCVRTLLAWGADQLQRDSSGRIPYSVAIKHNHGACAALLNPSAAEPLVWPSPLKFISELDSDARALLEVALMDANKESEKIILNERKKLLSPANVDEAFHDDASEASRSCGTTEALVNGLVKQFAQGHNSSIYWLSEPIMISLSDVAGGCRQGSRVNPSSYETNSVMPKTTVYTRADADGPVLPPTLIRKHRAINASLSLATSESIDLYVRCCFLGLCLANHPPAPLIFSGHDKDTGDFLFPLLLSSSSIATE
ncbi:hypothetical protein ZIOFF_006309 [Zingiber officinale]|uniref:Uncharacterized protein n=1 Tax=Zingiber officinale TaxID=94328 RepID=A0A8J5HS06_ZINOF|nr:hypothetical protein ZIOFF_006309 [Zingiber officinale]